MERRMEGKSLKSGARGRMWYFRGVFGTMADFSKLAQPGSPEELLVRRIDRTRLPRHVAIIMDGNGRWAKSRALPRGDGHRAGVAAARDAAAASAPPRPA